MYKHLGSIISCDGSDNPDVIRRVQLALAAYHPISAKIFGGKSVSMCLKLRMANSLVFSRLFYNVHLYSAVSNFILQKLGVVDMGVLRRIIGQQWQRGSKVLTDEAVRGVLCVRSLPTVLRQKRLIYLATLVRSDAHMLHAMLSFRGVSSDSPRMPWASLIADDLSIMADQLYSKVSSLGNPLLHPEAWSSIMVSYPMQWKALVECLRDSPSSDLPPLRVCGGDARHVCGVCREKGIHRAFPSEKALLSHCRVKHSLRNTFRNFIRDDNSCPVCKVVFSTRLRAIAHLCEKRRRGTRSLSCRDFVLRGAVCPLGRDVVDVLDAHDSDLRRQQKMKGKVTPLATYTAKRVLRVTDVSLPHRVPAIRVGTKRSWMEQLCLERNVGVPHRYKEVAKSPMRRLRSKTRVL